MRFHTNELTHSDFTKTVSPQALLLAGLDENVSVRVTEHGSRSHRRAFEFRVLGNGITNGGFSNDGSKAGTWDEWGVVIALLLGEDKSAVLGRVKSPTYDGYNDFHRITGWRFVNKALPGDSHLRHRWEHSPNYQACTKCSAVVERPWW